MCIACRRLWLGLLPLCAILFGGTEVRSQMPADAGSAAGATLAARPLPANPKPGQVFAQDLGGGLEMEMVWIPAGKFKMGSEGSTETLAKAWGGQAKSYVHEVPAHEVELDGFWMGKFVVTNAQYSRFNPNTPNGRPRFNDSNTSLPVTSVDWTESTAFCEWLSRQSGIHYTLPTEAQYEYACRAGTTTTFPWGNDMNDAGAWGNVADLDGQKGYEPLRSTDNLPMFNLRDGFVRTSPVGHYKPNNFGLYDTIGNVWEWCSDWYGKEYYKTSPARNPKGPDSGTSRVARGGSWSTHPIGCRSASRNFAPIDKRNGFLGFRVVANPAG